MQARRSRGGDGSQGGDRDGGGFAALVMGLALVSALFLLLPVPAVLLDVLLLGNLALAGGLLYVAARASDPRRLPFFPALLVLLVLLRLGISVGAVRLLLTTGRAGAVVGLFGSIVAGGDAVVGVVLLSVLALVQYLVIARGGERVAELAARFALDALPGQQAAIEADLRAGAISPAQGQEQRRTLLQEAQIFGAMDGALRFVKGDVVASLLVLVISLVGGVLHGLLSEGLSAGEALDRYALLTTGLGLATQVPVLLTAVAAGLLLTRGVTTAATAPGSLAASRAPLPARSDGELAIVAGPGLGLTDQALHDLIGRLRLRLGIPLPRARRTEVGPERLLAIRLRGAGLLSRRLSPDEHAVAVIEEALGRAAPELLGLEEVQRMLDELMRAQPALVRETVPRRIELPLLLSVLRRLLAEGVVPLPLPQVLDAVAALGKPKAEATDAVLLTEQVRGLLGRHLIENLREKAGTSRPSPDATDAQDTGDTGQPAFILDLDLEDAVREARRGEPGVDESLALLPQIAAELIAAAEQALVRCPGGVLLCHRDVRRHVAALLAQSQRALPVLAYSELPPLLPVSVMGRIGPGGLSPAGPDSGGRSPAGHIDFADLPGPAGPLAAD